MILKIEKKTEFGLEKNQFYLIISVVLQNYTNLQVTLNMIFVADFCFWKKLK